MHFKVLVVKVLDQVTKTNTKSLNYPALILSFKVRKRKIDLYHLPNRKKNNCYKFSYFSNTLINFNIFTRQYKLFDKLFGMKFKIII